MGALTWQAFIVGRLWGTFTDCSTMAPWRAYPMLNF